MNSLKRSVVQVIPVIICCHHIVQVICMRVVILSSCLTAILICIRDNLLSNLCMNMLLNKHWYYYSLLLY